MIEILHKVRDAICVSALWFFAGFLVCYVEVRPTGPPPQPSPAPIVQPVPAPAPAPAPAPQPIPVKHTGHLYLSYIEPRYGTPASAAVRDDLAAIDWHALDATFRAYVDGQEELTTLGFLKPIQETGLPAAFIQESGPKGAPIIGTVEGPASAAVVLSTVKGLRGQ